MNILHKLRHSLGMNFAGHVVAWTHENGQNMIGFQCDQCLRVFHAHAPSWAQSTRGTIEFGIKLKVQEGQQP